MASGREGLRTRRGDLCGDERPGGKYALRIHDEKGKAWRRRGPGTVAKGARADDKFILRTGAEGVEGVPGALQEVVALMPCGTHWLAQGALHGA